MKMHFQLQSAAFVKNFLPQTGSRPFMVSAMRGGTSGTLRVRSSRLVTLRPERSGGVGDVFREKNDRTS